MSLENRIDKLERTVALDDSCPHKRRAVIVMDEREKWDEPCPCGREQNVRYVKIVDVEMKAA